MMFFQETAVGQFVILDEIGFGAAVLLVLLLFRIRLYYRFQMRAFELAVPRVRMAICAHLYAGREYRPPLRHDFRTDLRMIFDLTRWRFRDFFPGVRHQEEAW